MALSLATAPTVELIDVETAKSHLNVFHADDDALIQGLCVAARQHVESFTRRRLLQQTWTDTRDGFPCGPIQVALSPVSAVSSITYVDTSGVTQTWSASSYRTDLPAGPWAQGARIEPVFGESYPATRDVINAVTIRVVVGYGTAVSDVPGPLIAATKLLIEHWYRHRGPTIEGSIISAVPMSVDALLWPYKVF